MSSDNRLTNINALRAFAALSVCWFHFTWHEDIWGTLFPSGHLTKMVGYHGLQGVYIFFVISGLVIPYSMEVAGYKWSMWWRFMIKRLVRLHPPYLMSMFVLAFFTLLYGVTSEGKLLMEWGRVAHHLLFTAPFFNVHWYQDVYWTLAVEFQYYFAIALMFPLLISKEHWVRWLSWLALVYASRIFDHDQKFIFFFHAPVFAVGIALWWNHMQRVSKWELALLLLIASVEIWYEVGPETMYATIGTACVILFVHWYDKVTSWLGDISYSIYLTHGLTGAQFLWATSHYATNDWQRYGLLAVAMAITVVGAWGFYYFIEVPSMRWSKKISYRGSVWKK